MRSARSVLLFCLALLAVSVYAQQPFSPSPSQSASQMSMTPNGPATTWVPHPIRDPQALGIVQASIAALGGAAAIEQLQTFVVQANIVPSPGSSAMAGTAVWTVAGGEFRSDYTSGQDTTTVGSGHGRPFGSLNGTVQGLPNYIVRSSFAPTLAASILLKEFQDPNYSIQFVGASTLGAESVVVVRTSSQNNPMDSLVTPQTWYFDSASNLPVRIEHRLPDVKISTRFLITALDLGTYKNISRVLFPSQVARSIGGKPTETATVISIQTNTNVAASVFDAPGGVQ
jgi:hypothetical protein